MLIAEAIMKTFISYYYFIDHLIHYYEVREVVHSYTLSVVWSVSQLVMFTAVLVLINDNAPTLIAVHFHVVSLSQCVHVCLFLCLDSGLMVETRQSQRSTALVLQANNGGTSCMHPIQL